MRGSGACAVKAFRFGRRFGVWLGVRGVSLRAACSPRLANYSIRFSITSLSKSIFSTKSSAEKRKVLYLA